MNISSPKPRKKTAAQAMVEFALALPILLLVVYGLLEAGRLLFMYASVVTAARNAARYGSATGLNSSGTNYYNDCPGIFAAANRVAFIQRFQTIEIAYDNGPNGSWHPSGCPITTAGHPANGDRIKVTVTSRFAPIVPLVPFTSFDITSTDARTLLVAAQIVVTPGPGGFTGGTALVVEKSTDTATYDHVGQDIVYHYRLRNIGTTDISGPFTIHDNKIGNFTCSGIPATLPGPSGPYSCPDQHYAITQADINSGSLTNTAFATNGDGTATSNYVNVTITLSAHPQISLVKEGTAPTVIAQGELIHYTFTITNTGNVPLHPTYTISDPLIGSNWICPPPAPDPLAVGAPYVCTGTYALKNTDINRGSVTNTATATALYNGTTVSASDTAVVLTPALFLSMTATPTSVTAVGQMVTYTYTVTNRTNSGMSNITITDTRGANKQACVSSLAAGATATCTYTNKYTVTQVDFDSPTGYFSNTATASAQGNIQSNQAGVNVTIAQNALLALTKTAAPTLKQGQTWSNGQAIQYRYALQNTGNVTITFTTSAPLTIVDSDTRVAMAASCHMTTGSLAPGASLTPLCTGSLILSDADIAAGSITSTGTASAYFGTASVSATASYTLVTFFDPRLGLVKTPDQTYFTGAGETIHYSYAIRNTGGQQLTITTAYSLFDDKLGTVPCPLATPGTVLDLGASISCDSRSYPTTPADVTARSIVNTVSVASGSTTPATAPSPVTVTVTLLTCDSTHPASQPNVPIAPLSNTSWGILNNTGATLHVVAATISWNGGILQQILLQVPGSSPQQVWTGSAAPNGTLSLPVTGWPAIPYNLTTPTVMSLKFSTTATNIKVSLTFAESVGGTSCSITSP